MLICDRNCNTIRVSVQCSRFRWQSPRLTNFAKEFAVSVSKVRNIFSIFPITPNCTCSLWFFKCEKTPFHRNDEQFNENHTRITQKSLFKLCMFSRIDAATHAVSAERNNIGIHGAGRISHIRPFPKIRQIELHHSPSASGARWTQWLIDNNNFTPKTRNHFLCTLFHFSLHDFHLNSIIHNKWPRSFVVCRHYPQKNRWSNMERIMPTIYWCTRLPCRLATDKHFKNRIAKVCNSNLCIRKHVIFWMSVVMCLDKEK